MRLLVGCHKPLHCRVWGKIGRRGKVVRVMDEDERVRVLCTAVRPAYARCGTVFRTMRFERS
jgi:hypothetical protein